MIEYLKKQNDLDMVLSKMDASDLDKLYSRVFSSEDGELVMHDMANRCCVFHPSESEREEGMRALWLSIYTRLRDAVQIKKEV